MAALVPSPRSTADDALNRARTGTLTAAVLSRDASFRWLMREVLGDLGLQAHAEEEHAGAVQRVARLKPDLILLDIDIAHERLDWALLDALLEHPGTANIPVIACSAAAWVLEERELRLRRDGIPTWTEPFALSDLLGCLATVQDGPVASEPPNARRAADG
jgi:CheY-like chemotaxis protein